MIRAQAERRTADPRTMIVDAAAQLLRDQGADAVTTRAVAAAAGVQAPTIYRLFGDKDGLVDAVAEQVLAAYVTAKAAADEGDSDPVAHLRSGWATHLDFALTNPELYALLSAPGRTRRSPAMVAGMEVLRGRVRRIAAAGLLRVDEQRALQIIHAAGTGTIVTLLNSPVAERDPGLGEAMFQVVASSILTTAPAVTDAGVSPIVAMFLTVLPDLPALTEAERTLMAEWVARSLARLREPC